MNHNTNAESVPKFYTVSPSPHIKNPTSTRTIMFDVLVALTPALIFACYSFGMRALTVTLISIVSCVAFEALYELILKKPLTITDLSAAVTGMLLALNLPVTVPFWIPVVGAAFAIIIVKQLFGGIGKNVVNPALAARVFLFSWPDIMSDFTNPGARLSAFAPSGSGADIVSGATPLMQLKGGAIPDIPLIDLIIGNQPGVIGEVSALLLTAGFIYLLVRKVITWHIPVAYIGTVALLTFVFPSSASVLPYEFMASQLCSGGLFLGAIFMATDYATSPVTKTGRLIFGVGCGLITVFIRYYGGYNEGVSFAILIMNLLVWYIDKFTRPTVFGAKTVIPDRAPAPAPAPAPEKAASDDGNLIEKEKNEGGKE